jgi:hypothetical protein
MKYFDPKDIKIQTIDAHNHREELRRALLTSPYWDKKPSILSNIILFVKGGEKNMNIKRFALFGAMIAVFVAVGVFALTNTKVGNSTVYAKELAQKSVQTVVHLSPGEKQTLGVPTDAESLLNEAQSAKDLVVLTYDQVKDMLPGTLAPDTVPYQKESGQRMVVETKGDPQEAMVKFQQAKFLQFTKSGGERVLIAVDQNNVPFFTNIRFGK